MTNKDKYLKDGVDVEEFICGLRDYLDSHNDNYDTSNLINNYLNKTVKPTLTEDEKVILRNLQQEIYKYIGRDDRGYLYIAKRNKNDFSGRGMNLAVYDVFGHLFQFIKPRRRI